MKDSGWSAKALFRVACTFQHPRADGTPRPYLPVSNFWGLRLLDYPKIVKVMLEVASWQARLLRKQSVTA